MRKHSKQHGAQAGLTLFELTTVLSLLGVMVSGGFVGHRMLQNAKTNAVVLQAHQLGTAVLVFYDKYGVYPGDERRPNIPPGDFNDSGNEDWRLNPSEQAELFQDLQLAGLIAGPFNGQEDLMPNPFEGTLSLTWTKASSADKSPKHYFKFTLLPAEACQEIDLKYDDGNPHSGSIIGSSDYEPGTTLAALYYRFQAL